ncbi:MAG: (d)CMP kinase [Candidatus Cyclobacteriaceae bacterium M2_1C_046]
MKKITIAIDGYSACGKSTTAKALAAVLGYTYIDTGAMYRAVTLYFLDNYISLTNKKEILKALDNINISFKVNPDTGKSEACLNGLDVEKEIRKMRVTEKVSPVSAIPEVRKAMVAQQQKMGKGKGTVMDGRDIGTVVFPDAELKLFMTADINIRAARRQQELLDKGQMVELEKIKHNLAERDRIDSTREEGPLKKAEDAIYIDTSFITIDEQVDQIIELVVGRLIKAAEVEAE